MFMAVADSLAGDPAPWFSLMRLIVRDWPRSIKSKALGTVAVAFQYVPSSRSIALPTTLPLNSPDGVLTEAPCATVARLV